MTSIYLQLESLGPEKGWKATWTGLDMFLTTQVDPCPRDKAYLFATWALLLSEKRCWRLEYDSEGVSAMNKLLKTQYPTFIIQEVRQLLRSTKSKIVERQNFYIPRGTDTCHMDGMCSFG